eukprot:jgi/Tetstr1/442284/TSEL_030425.t1
MSGSGSTTGPEMVDAGKAAAVEDVEAPAIAAQASIEAGQLGSPEFTELLELYKDRMYDANIASAAKTSAPQHFVGDPRCNDRDRDGGGGSRDNFKNLRSKDTLLGVPSKQRSIGVVGMTELPHH